MSEDDFEELKKKKEKLDKIIEETGMKLYFMPDPEKLKPQLEELDKLINNIKNEADIYYISMNLNKTFAESYKKRGDMNKYKYYMRKYKEYAQELKRRLDDLETLTDLKLSIIRGDPIAFRDSVTKIFKNKQKK